MLTTEILDFSDADPSAIRPILGTHVCVRVLMITGAKFSRTMSVIPLIPAHTKADGDTLHGRLPIPARKCLELLQA
jgi:hypothetical protein